MVITTDHAWLSTFKEVKNTSLVSFFCICLNNRRSQDEEMVYDPEQLLEQVLVSHDVCIKNGEYSNLDPFKIP